MTAWTIKSVNRALHRALLCLCCLVASPAALAAGVAAEQSVGHDVVDMYIRDDVYADYLRFLNGREPLEVNQFSGDYVRRDVVDMVLVQQALALGGFRKSFTYRPGNINFRHSNLLEQGKLLLSFDSYWYADAKAKADKLFISDAVIRRGEYFAGIFYAPDNLAVARITGLSELRELSAVSTSRWRTDWQTLASLGLKHVMNEPVWASQAQMVNRQWVDFMLMPLMPSLNNEFRLDEIVLVAHPNLVVQFDGSRHFVVSRLHPDGERAFKALQSGLKQLRARGTIRLAYEQAGFIPDLKRYRVLNPIAPQKNSPE
ncbi:hypothetical protein L1285_04175 [Pseudoalteromonas sp. DL2-H2.2]|uniref:hypothetical protein n=1 Tax=Pseudoalteromonas sp. DL2-H2.2 TaxID=2908889 RepID=UPI001F41DAC5|nr:hypothetical protein [Pseudoalteromonas sp. DL2-H2.2]MCF2907514.1 hypothetical protein [Pseudoalteromonas sp. DL2-H2.2]